MPGYRHILRDKDATERIARLTLNHPERLNALNDSTMDGLGDALYKGLEFELDTAMTMAAAAETITLTSITITSLDHAEGTAATRESRKPAYEGR